MEVGFAYGALCDDLETQANKQGFTLGEKAEMLEELRHSYLMLVMNDCITDSQKGKILQKIQKKVVKSLKPLNCILRR